MRFYRLIKPTWAQPYLANGEKNPKFIQEIKGPNVYEGCDYTKDFVDQKNAEGYNVYFFPNHPSRDVYKEDGIKHLNGRVIEVFEYVFVDMDLKDGVYSSKQEFLQRLAEFELKPTMVVDSGNGVHAYWKMNQLNRGQYMALQLALINIFKTDQSVWSVLQLMRLPNSNNTKKLGEYKRAEILKEYSSGCTYDVTEFRNRGVDMTLTDDQKAKIQSSIARLEGRELVDLGADLDVDELPSSFIALMEKNEQIRELFQNPTGDRSSADMKLANKLFTEGLDIREATAVIANTQKALEKGSHRLEYAKLTVHKVYGDRPKHKFQTVFEYLNSDEEAPLGAEVRGPMYLDWGVLQKPWRTKQILGIIGGSGIGKTALALNILRDMIKNNVNNDDVFIFFSLEMPKSEVIEKWVEMVGNDVEMASRLYVIDTEGEDESAFNYGLQEIHEVCTEIRQVSGRKVGAIVIDHFHILSSHIDITKKPNFGIFNEQGAGYGNIRNLSLENMATQIKALTKSLDIFTIILSQTTKEKGEGDTAIAKGGSYGNSQFEWIVDRALTIWQPLMRVQHMTRLSVLAYQYTKNRHKHDADVLKEFQTKLLTFDMVSGTFRAPTQREFQEFEELNVKAMELREEFRKKKTVEYSIQTQFLNEADQIMQNQLKVVSKK